MSIKTKLIGGASVLAIAGGMLAVAAPPSGAVVTTIGTCQNLLALGSAKSATINPSTGKPYGITDKDNLDGAISSKGVDPNLNKGTNLGSCSFPSNATNGVPDGGKPVAVWSSGTKTLTKWSTKLYSREFDCNITDGVAGPNPEDKTEWAPSGTLSLTFSQIITSTGKNAAISAFVVVDGFTDPDSNPATASDVVALHGIVTKGAALGADVNGETEFDPTVKDNTQTTATPYFGYQFDLGGAIGCQDDATVNPANILLFNNGSVGGVSQLLGLPVSGIEFTKGTP